MIISIGMSPVLYVILSCWLETGPNIDFFINIFIN